MARPQKSDADKRTHYVKMRVTETEKSHIQQQAQDAALTPSDFLRGMALRAKPGRKVPTPDRAMLLKLMAELNMIGSNLNQIARALNRRQDSPDLTGMDWIALNAGTNGVDAITKHLMEILQ